MLVSRRQALTTGLGFTAGMVLTGPAALARAASRPWSLGQDDPNATFFPWKELAQGIHAVIDPDTGGNTLLIQGTDAAVLIDTKFPAIGKALLREAEARGVRLRHVINTHHHGDHTGGNQAFNAAGIEIIAHAKAEPRVLANWEQYVGQAGGGPRFVGGLKRPTQEAVLQEAGELSTNLRHMDVTDWGPTRLMDGDTLTLEFGGRTAVLTHFGQAAHTDNDTVVHIPDADVLHTGDLVFSGLHPYFDPSAGVTARGWAEVLTKLRATCTDKTIVVPGHGAVGDASIIDKQRDYLLAIIDAVQKEIAAGTTREDAIQKTWPFMDGLGFEQVRPRAIGAVYDELSNG